MKTVVVAAALAVATTTVVVWHPWHRSVPPPLDAALSYTQDAAGVHVNIHNPNSHWGLRNQPVRIWLRAAAGDPINFYGPDMDTRDNGSPGKSLHCCLITYLPPHGDFTFDLLRTGKDANHTTIVASISVTLKGGDQWIHM